MTAFLMSLGYIFCFILGGYVTFRFCEYYNGLLRDVRVVVRRKQRRPEDEMASEQEEVKNG